MTVQTTGDFITFCPSLKICRRKLKPLIQEQSIKVKLLSDPLCSVVSEFQRKMHIQFFLKKEIPTEVFVPYNVKNLV